jgi:hypothetical protein
MNSFPGAGPVLTPRLIAASGKQRWVHWRWACPIFLRQTFHEWALHSIATRPGLANFTRAACQGKVKPDGDPGPGVQMDPRPLSLLEGWQALRRTTNVRLRPGPRNRTETKLWNCGGKM